MRTVAADDGSRGKPQGEKRQRAAVTQGEIPSPLNIPTGCRFRTRCPMAQPICETPPPDVAVGPSHNARCHFAAAPINNS